jgi:hypothetical protein
MYCFALPATALQNVFLKLCLGKLIRPFGGFEFKDEKELN